MVIIKAIFFSKHVSRHKVSTSDLNVSISTDKDVTLIQPELSCIYKLATVFTWLTWNEGDLVRSGHVCQNAS